MRYINGVNRKQAILFPEIIDEYVEDNNPVRFMDAFVDSLDLKELSFSHAELESTGRPPYHPADLLKLYIYGYLNRIRSSRSLEKESRRNVELMWLLKKLAPDFKTIADFRKDRVDAVKKVCKEFIFLCKRLDLFGGELVAIDGSKFRAVNSKHRNFNEKKLKKKLEGIEEKIEGYLRELEENDEKESGVNSPDRQELEAKIEELKERRGEHQKLLGKLEELGESQISLTDPDSRAMMDDQRIEVCYNLQISVDEKHKLILDHEITNEVTDNNQLSKMAKRAKEVLGVEELEVLADKGYYDGDQIKECLENGIIPYIPEKRWKGDFSLSKFKYDKQRDLYICPAGAELRFTNLARSHGKLYRLYKSKQCISCPFRSKCTKIWRGRMICRWEHQEILEEMKKRVKANKQKVKLRQQLAEHPFGTLKRGFGQGYLLLKGLRKVGGEASLSVLAYNLKRAINVVGVKRLVSSIRQNPYRFSFSSKYWKRCLFLKYLIPNF